MACPLGLPLFTIRFDIPKMTVQLVVADANVRKSRTATTSHWESFLSAKLKPIRLPEDDCVWGTHYSTRDRVNNAIIWIIRLWFGSEFICKQRETPRPQLRK